MKNSNNAERAAKIEENRGVHLFLRLGWKQSMLKLCSFMNNVLHLLRMYALGFYTNHISKT